MTNCESASGEEYCCAADESCNCATGNNITRIEGRAVRVTTIGVLASITSASNSSLSSPTSTSRQTISGTRATTTATAAAASGIRPLDDGTAATTAKKNIIGIGISLGVIGLIACATVGFLFRRSSRQRAEIRDLQAQLEQCRYLVVQVAGGVGGGGGGGLHELQTVECTSKPCELQAAAAQFF